MKNNNQKFGDLGQTWTPQYIVNKMIALIENTGPILEPAAGIGRFAEQLDCIALEIDSLVVPNNLNNKYIIDNFFNYSIDNKFSTIITNPPYINGRLLDTKWFGSWKGFLSKTANAYLHFIEKSIQHLKDNGELIFIVPSAFLSDTSFGKPLRDLMFKNGFFTHIYFENKIKWDNASIDEILIFRWQKGLNNKKVKTYDGEKFLINNNGFLWLLDFEPKGTIGDFFKAAVGSAPLKIDIENGNNSTNSDYYIKEGKPIKVCENNIKNWPRMRNTNIINKIFFVGRPIRKWPVFFAGTSAKHIDWVLLPKKDMDVINITKFINEWFQKYGESLGLIKLGRWKVGIKQIESCPINSELYNLLDGLN